MIAANSLWIWTAIAAVVSYLVCGIPFGLVIAAAMGHIDVRSVGSGNIGTTNVARSVGKKAAAATLLLDVLKGVVCVSAARALLAAVCLDGNAALLERGSEASVAVSVVFAACILGHVFSPYLHFHGGKGIAVGFGAALALHWPVAVGLLVVFVALAVPSRYVSLGSVAAALSLPLWCLAFGFAPVSVAPVAVVALVVVWAHRENIRKLLHGEERRFAFHKSGEPAGK